MSRMDQKVRFLISISRTLFFGAVDAHLFADRWRPNSMARLKVDVFSIQQAAGLGNARMCNAIMVKACTSSKV